jgi:hypothetical protein
MNVLSDHISCIKVLMVKVCGLETSQDTLLVSVVVRTHCWYLLWSGHTVGICCGQDTLLVSAVVRTHCWMEAICFYVILFCVSCVAECWMVLGCSGASVVECVMAFKRITMSVNIYQLKNIISQCLQSFFPTYFLYISLFTGYHKISNRFCVNIMDWVVLL